MQRVFNLGLLLLFSLVLVSCGTTSAFKVVSNKPQAWQAFQEQASAIKQWQVSGVIGVIKDKQAISGGYVWQQNGKEYQMDINGPLGLGAIQLKGEVDRSIALRHKGKTYQASDSAALMQQQLGWQVPVNGLLYWARGIPVPGMSYHKTINPYGFTQAMQQQGWSIEYEAYRHVSGCVLPEKVVLQREHLRIKLVMDQWHIQCGITHLNT